MGYSTDFYGKFFFSRPLTHEEKKYLVNFNESRHMKRDVNKLWDVHKGKHGSIFVPEISEEAKHHIESLEGMGFSITLTKEKDDRTPEQIYGVDGEFFVARNFVARNEMDGSVLDANKPPVTQPSLWCRWVPTKDGEGLEWDGGEKFYYYIDWLKYLINKFFQPWGVILNGEVKWEGEDNDDVGIIVVKDNVVKIKKAKIVFEEEDDE